MKNYLLKSKLFAWAYREGGKDAFQAAHSDILESMDEEIERRAKKYAIAELESLLSAVKTSEIIAQKGKLFYIGGELADDATLSNLSSEAHFLKESQLWRILNETPKELAHRAMFVDDGTIENQLLKGRAILYMLATQTKIVNLLTELSTGKE